jgi:NDP-sugar pyrophosphorylase family protein
MTKAIIIAGGKGERLKPLTYEMAKCLIPVHKRTLIDNAFDLFWKHRVYEVWLSLGHLYEQVTDKYPTNPFWIDFHSDDRKIIQLGTGGWANRLSKDSIEAKKLFNEPFYVCNADNLFNLDLNEMMALHKRGGYLVTIACTKVKDVSEYGSVAIKDSMITNFEEKKRSRIKKSGWVNGGYYIFSPEVFDIIAEMKIDVNKPFSLEKDLFPVLATKKKLGAYKSDGQWFDTGTFDRWEKVLREWVGIK